MPIHRSFYFIRHGQTDWNKEERLQGHTDIPLNDIGRAQAKEVLKLISDLPIDLIITSDLLRSKETAEIINEKLQLPLTLDKKIRERCFGDLEGKTITECQAGVEKALKENLNLIEEDTGYLKSTNGETYEEFRLRILEAINTHLNNNPNKNILFSSHCGMYETLHRTIFKEAHHSDNAHTYSKKQKTTGKL